jgi:hypothetical protein
MRIAHIILVHKNPVQLEYLIKTMSHPDFDFYIHLDKKTDIIPFAHLTEIDQVYFIKNNIICNWGGYSIVEAICRSIDQVQQSGITYDFVNLLSGQDFPIKPVNEIHDFFNNKLGFSFLSFDHSNDTKWWKDTESKYKKFHLTDMEFKGKYIVQNILNAITPERTFLNSIKLYGGSKSTWWTITYDCALYVSNYLKVNPKIVNFLRFTWGSDEYIITTILMNSHHRNKIINENYRYIDWSGGKAHPKSLTIADYKNIINSGNMFARKFDTDIDKEILYKLNEHISVD